MIKEVKYTDVIISMKQHLGLLSTDFQIDETLLACCIRRLAGFLCPCSKRTLTNSIIESLNHLEATSESDIKSQIEEVIEKLIIGNDLLELSEVSTNDLGVKGTWIFSAHPAYLVRNNGSILIFGVVPDELSPISSLSERIIYKGCRRYILPKVDEDLGQTLKDLGLMKITESAWLKLPKVQTASNYLADMNKKLYNALPSGDISGLIVLDSNRKNTYYNGRWTEQRNMSGNFVAKRPHLYGGYIWCYVELKDGVLIRFIDIPFKHNGINQRGCDGGWYLQMALDYCAGHAQVYNIRSIEEGDVFEFYSPIPQWAERRLIAFGEPIESPNCIFAYLIPKDETIAEEKFLKETLWLSHKA